MQEKYVTLPTGLPTVRLNNHYLLGKVYIDRLVAWDLLGEMTWSSEMGFMKTGSDIKNMIHIGELSMMYLGLVSILGPLEWKFVWLTSFQDRSSAMGREAPQHEPVPPKDG